jgi:16S rRNA (adenine(1408)-N(1))-methyltransferase
MAESSRRADRPAGKGGVPNLLFVVAAAERPPDVLRNRVDDVRIVFPWGSLLRGALALDDVAAAGIAALVAPGGIVQALVSVAERDSVTTDLRPLTAGDGETLARRWAAHGLTVTCFEPAAPEVVAASGSTWARRLTTAAGATRPVWQLELRRDSGDIGRAG